MNGRGLRVGLLLAGLISTIGCSRKVEFSGIAPIAALRSLTDSQLKAGSPVKVSGVVTFAEMSVDSCILQDSTGGIRVDLLPGQPRVYAGTALEVSGFLVRQGKTPAILGAKISRSEPASLPAPLAPANWSFPHPPECRLVTISGIVRGASMENAALALLEMRSGGFRIYVRIPDFSKEYDSLVDAEASVTGVISTNYDVNGNIASYTLSVHDARNFSVSRPAPAADSLSVTSVAEVLRFEPKNRPVHRIRMSGLVRHADGKTILSDATGQIELNAELPDGPSDVVGFLSHLAQPPLLKRVQSLRADRDQASQAHEVVRTARAVHALPAAVAARHLPVELRGVISYCDDSGICFVQDRTDGIFLNVDPSVSRPHFGERVVVTGITAPGDFAPVVNRAKFQVLGKAPLPIPGKFDEETAFLGGDDSRWIEVNGVVRSATLRALRVAHGSDYFDVHSPEDDSSLLDLVDARVRLTGVCGTVFNLRRQLVGLQVFVPGRRYITIEGRSPVDPFALPVRSAGSLFSFSTDGHTFHRVHLRGVVTVKGGSQLFWIRDESGGVRVQSAKMESLAPGDLVDVAGFPAPRGLSPVIEEALVRVIGHPGLPAPSLISPIETTGGRYHSEWVQMDGLLLDSFRQHGERNLILQSGNAVFSARFDNLDSDQLPAPGSTLRVRGICSMFADNPRDQVVPNGFELILNSARDIEVLHVTSWWSPAHLQLVIAITLVVIALALGWALLLRRQVVSQTHKLIRKAEQLEEAKTTVESALQRAQKAESLEQQKKRILELVARDEPLEQVLKEIIQAIETHSGGLCSIQLGEGERERLSVTPHMPADWQLALAHLNIAKTRLGARYRCPSELSPERSWTEFLKTASGEKMRTVFAVPVMAAGRRVGIVCVFYQQGHQVGDPEANLILSWCGLVAMAQERRSLYEQLSYRAKHDELTGLPNRVVLFERLNAELEAAKRDSSVLGLLYIDLDGFKKINDALGHAVGDMVLQTAGERMIATVRRGDTVARVGGDEFVILLPSLGNGQDAELIAQKLAAAVREPIFNDGQKLLLGASIGISLFPEDGADPRALLRTADQRMYRHKIGSKTRIPSDTAAAKEEKELFAV